MTKGDAIRGDEEGQEGFIVFESLEDRVPPDHSLRSIRRLVDPARSDLTQPICNLLHYLLIGSVCFAGRNKLDALTRNERVRGSSPFVGFPEVTAKVPPYARWRPLSHVVHNVQHAARGGCGSFGTLLWVGSSNGSVQESHLLRGFSCLLCFLHLLEKPHIQVALDP